MTVPIRDASTVVLLRDGPGGVEAWMLTRQRGMVFAGGMTVFPGGRVDESDAAVPWSGPPPSVFAGAFGCDETTARALVAAAVRETFEETGVLLTDPPASLPADRAAVEAGTRPFGELLRAHGLAIDAATVRPWARWITPDGEVRRYDTRFFLAALPDASIADAATIEASAAGWVPITEALAMDERAERVMLPPTRATLCSLLPFDTVAAALAAADGRALDPVEPRLRLDLEPVAVELPDGTIVAIDPGMVP